MLHLAGVNKHAGLRVAGYERWRSSTSMDQANGSVDRRKVQVSAFDHPGSELDDLSCGKCVLRDEPANYGIADA